MSRITSHLQQRDEPGDDESRTMPKSQRIHPDWKRGDRADGTIPPAELLSQKETRRRYVGPHESSCLDVTIVFVVRDVRQAEETRNVLLDHPANSQEEGVALFSNSLSKTAATQQLTSVSS